MKHTKRAVPRARAGETLIEVLIALLVIMLATLLLAVMLNAAVSIDANARRQDVDFYQTLTDVETRGGTKRTDLPGAHVQITDDANGSTEVATLDVDVYGSNGLTSYSLAETEGGE